MLPRGSLSNLVNQQNEHAMTEIIVISPVDLAATLKRLCEDDNWYKQLSERAPLLVKKFFLPDKYISALTARLTKLCRSA